MLRELDGVVTVYQAPEVPVVELFAGASLLDQYGNAVDVERALVGRITLLYFSAGWCEPCKQFTPVLKDFYVQVRGLPNGSRELEVLFVSNDKAPEEMAKHHREDHGTWPAVDYGSEIHPELYNRFQVKQLPSIVALSPHGKTLMSSTRCIREITRAVRSGEFARTMREWKRHAGWDIPDEPEALPAPIASYACPRDAAHEFGRKGSRLRAFCKGLQPVRAAAVPVLSLWELSKALEREGVPDVVVKVGECYANADKLNDALGWRVVYGYKVLELPSEVEGGVPDYISVEHAWNEDGRGKFRDFTPTPDVAHDPKAFLLESPLHRGPGAYAERPADLEAID